MRKSSLVILGLVAAALLCGVLVCSLGGLAWALGRLERTMAPTQAVLPARTGVPTPAVREPSSPEQLTARVVEVDVLPQRDLVDLARRLGGRPAGPVATPASPPAYELGDVESFWVHNTLTSSFFTAEAVLSYETDHAYWWVEQGYALDDRALARSARNFEEQTYPTNHRIFGSEWSPGIDGDPHVYIFLGNVPGLGGLFSGPDEYPASIRDNSNEHEMFYISLENAQPGTKYFDGILAHEHQHMIHWAIDRDEDTWLNEGLSELAAHVNGYDGGSTEWIFAAAPDTQLNTWPDLEETGASYGGSYLFLTYFYEQYGEEAIRRLVQEEANGLAAFAAVLDEIDPGRTVKDLFADWVAANYLDDDEMAGNQYGYADVSLDRPSLSARHATYPVERQAAVPQYAADYILLEGEGDVHLDFTGSTLVSLVGNEPHAGSFQWWSQRGDEGDATLTRAFDLRQLQTATLQAWMWYDLEVDYDYAYVQVSADGGESWDLLANEHTTKDNPSGSSYGPALNGLSGGGQEAEWVLQSFDLTPYAGRQIQVRFEVVTDDSLNHPGLCLDDIAIPELGYLDGAEQGDGGWQAEGWLRVTGDIPQEFLVQVILFGDTQVRVERLALDPQQRGSLRLGGLGGEVEEAVLVISGLAPATTEPAGYTYRVTPENDQARP